MRNMLRKGDKLRPEYASFDYNSLDSSQQMWIKLLGVYPKYRTRVELYFEDCKISSDMKLLFVEQHSMKLGDRIFYDLEGRRQKWIDGLEMAPYIGGIFGLVYFIGFAIKAPLSSKLYKESLYSLMMGMATAGTIPLYYRYHYTKTVNSIYNQLVERFEMYPHLEVPDSGDSIKNFGMNKWNDTWFEGEDDIELDETINPFEGNVEVVKVLEKAEFYDAI